MGGFVTAIEPAEDGIMDIPPRRVGKRLIGRYLLLRIFLGTFILILTVLLSVAWARENGYTETEQMQSQAFNTLDLGAISICLSARFAYNSSIHPRLFSGDKWCWWSILLVIVLQIMITYIPGLNDVIFQMEPMDIFQWLISVAGMVITFIFMEAEKAIRRVLKARGNDTDDRELTAFDDKDDRTSHIHLPEDAAKLGTAELKS